MQISSLIFLAVPAAVTVILALTMAPVLAYLKERLSSARIRQQSGFNELMLKKEIGIREQIFQEISLELHDRVGHFLSVARMQLDIIEPRSPLLVEAATLVNLSLEELRTISRSLNADVLHSQGLYNSLEWELGQIGADDRLTTEIEQRGETYFLEDEQELALIRIAQECFSNIIKHSESSRIVVSLDFQPRFFLLKICDNGKGFSADNNLHGRNLPGCGITNMYKRCQAINAGLSIITKPGAGTEVIVKIKIHDKGTAEDQTRVD